MIELPLNLINAKSPYEVSYAAPDRFTIRAASAVVEGKGFYAAIIVENRNPLLKNIIADFETTTQVLTAGKP